MNIYEHAQSRGMGLTLESVLRKAQDRSHSLRKQSSEVAVSLEQLIRLMVAPGPALDAALPKLRSQSPAFLPKALAETDRPISVIEASSQDAAIETPAHFDVARIDPLPAGLTNDSPQEAVETAALTEARQAVLLLPEEELRRLIESESGMAKPLMQALLLQYCQSQTEAPAKREPRSP